MTDTPDLFSTVSLRSDRTSWDGERVPAGACGTVVEILKDGEACVVDVVEPFDAVVTVDALNLSLRSRKICRNRDTEF